MVTRTQAGNCYTLAFVLADCMTDVEFRAFWRQPFTWMLGKPDLFDLSPSLDRTLGAAGGFVVGGRLTRGLGLSSSRVTRGAIASALIYVCDFAGWEVDNEEAE